MKLARPMRSLTSLWICVTLALLLAPAVALAEPVISEFMASNTTTLADDDGAYPDWIEIYNPDATPASLSGWYLTDSTKKKTKWAFPAVTIAPQGYLVVFADGKDRSDPARPLHTNFSLDASGEYLALVRPDGTPASEFSPTYPAQHTDISYGITQPASGPAETGYFRKATPGAANGGHEALMLFDTVSYSRSAGLFSGPFSLSINGTASNSRIRYVVATPSSTGATVPEPTAASTLYTGPITVSSSVIIRAAVFSADDSLHGPSSVVQFVKLGASAMGFSTQLPILVLDDHGLGALTKDDVDHPAWLYSFPANSGGAGLTVEAEAASPINLTVRGSSSASFPKKSYSLEVRDEFGGKGALPLGGGAAFAKWALVGPWYFDHTLIKNAFVYALSNQLGHWAPHTKFVEVFFNTSGGDLDMSDYAGVYLLADRIEVDKDRVDIASLSSTDTTSPDVTGGYILKIDAPSTGDYSWITDHGIPYGSSALIVDSPSDLNAAQKSYIKSYVQQMENALYADSDRAFGTRTYLDYIDRASWVDYHIINTFVMNFDALNRSAYFTKDRGGKLKAGPVWDYDRSFGAATYFEKMAPEVWNAPDGTPVWEAGWWGILALDPEFRQDWVDRWQELRKNELSDANLTSLADLLGNQVGAAATARDAARWPDDPRFPAGVTGGVADMKNWMVRRTAWIDSQFAAPPVVSNNGATLHLAPPAGAQVIYTLDGSDPRSLGGGIAPNAVVSSTAVDVPASANLHARTYRAEMKNNIPGSPWSSAVTGPSSSPLLPVARLVNLSSRGYVGTGENALIAGAVVSDTASKRYLARAVGPGLALFGASGIVPDPQLSIFDGRSVELYRNNGWEKAAMAGELAADAKSVGAFPLSSGSLDSALAVPLSSGSYTLQVTTPTGQPGVGLAELYELDNAGRTLNLSTRAFVRSGDNVLIGGFVVDGPAYKRMLLRAVGPTLSTFGVASALADPVLTVYSGQTVVATNDRWAAGDGATKVAAATSAVGAFALASNSEDAALLITLPPGAYTVEVKGKNNAEGVALLEIYDVP